MKFTIPAPDLKVAVSLCAKVADKRARIPILNHVRIDAGDGLKIRASDLNTYVAIDVAADVAVRGEICAPADELLKFATAAGKSVLSIEVFGHALRIAWGRSSAALNTLPAEDFPMPSAALEMRSVDGNLLTRAMRYCMAAVNPSEPTEYLQGVYLFDAPDGGRIYGTDGKVAHRAVTPGSHFGGTAIIHARDVAMLCDIALTRFAISETGWAAAADGIEIRGRVIEGSFPDVDRVIPSPPLAAIVDREALADAVTTASIGADDPERTRPVVVDVRDGSIHVRGLCSIGALAAGTRTEIEADTKAYAISAFGARYLLATLGAMDVDLVALMMGEGKAVVEPAQQLTELRLTSVVMGRLASEQELAA